MSSQLGNQARQVELTITAATGSQTVRTWVLDVDDSAIIYYDAEPELVTTLQSGQPVKFKRQGLVRTLVPKTTPVSDLPPEEMGHIFECMNTKYGQRNQATAVYYSMLGRSRDRVAVIVALPGMVEEEASDFIELRGDKLWHLAKSC